MKAYICFISIKGLETKGRLKCCLTQLTINKIEKIFSDTICVDLYSEKDNTNVSVLNFKSFIGWANNWILNDLKINSIELTKEGAIFKKDKK